MRRISIFLIFLCLACQISRATVVYVSSSTGNDTNDGLTQELPLKTVNHALSVADTVLLKSGDVFYENITIRRGMLSKYGGKQLPVLSGFKRIIEPRWQKVGENLWKISLSDNNFTGFDTEGTSLLNNIGCIYEYDKDVLHGRKYQKKSQLTEDWDIWQTEHYKDKEVTEHDFDTLYLYLHDNPSNLRLAFSVGAIAVRISDATLNHIRIEGFGFGVSARSNTTVRDCEIDAIGGKTIVPNSYYVCYGNGIEFYMGYEIKNCLVENNKISRCYDCACTIQGSDNSAKNVIFRGNLIMDCCQGWEDYLSNKDPKVAFYDCFFENNIVVNSGNTSGFGYSKGRAQYGHVLCTNYMGNKGMIIRGNTFVGGNFLCAAEYNGEYKSTIWNGNTCYIRRGEWLLKCVKGNDTFIRVPTVKEDYPTLKVATDEAIKQYRQLTGDNTTRFVVLSDKKMQRKINKYKKNF